MTVNLKNRIKEANIQKLKEQTIVKHFVTWFEIPAYNHYRSVAFYNYIFGIEMTTVELNGFAMSFFLPKTASLALSSQVMDVYQVKLVH